MALRDRPHWLFRQRRAGVLLHPTSLPGPDENGTLGAEAFRFVDFLAECGFGLWQTLPIGPTHKDRSPYQSLSVQAGNPELIGLDDLVSRGWLSAEERHSETHGNARLIASQRFFEQCRNDAPLNLAFEHFCREHRHWLDDYALFDATREHYERQSWKHWPDDVRLRRTQGLIRMRRELKEPVAVRQFEQFVFFQQWQALRDYANEKNVYLFGDMPIFVAYDSADVWANQELFKLDGDSLPLTVAGVPPDYFSESGQHWGNPHYNWDEMQAQGFRWWRQRFASQLVLFDLIRLDHFRGLEAYWEIPAQAPEPVNGQWVKAPGRALLNSLFREYKSLPLVAENLGFITSEVEQLRREFRLPGMVVLQFGFDGTRNNPHLPHEHDAHNVVYTGTHDNNTTLGWYESESPELRQRLRDYCFCSNEPMPQLLVRAALASVAKLAIIPLQDIMLLDGQHRMNTPGTEEGNWHWRFQWEQMPPDLGPQNQYWLKLYDRLPQTPDAEKPERQSA